jgi:23S rRNA (guanosine2251-2'-O)-methyltransferase
MIEILYGRNAVFECLRAGHREVLKLIVAQGAQERDTLADTIALAGERQIPVQRVDPQQLDRLGHGVHHQGIMAEVGYCVRPRSSACMAWSSPSAELWA